MLASVIGPVIYGNQVITAGRTEYHDGALGLRLGCKQDERSSHFDLAVYLTQSSFSKIFLTVGVGMHS